MTTEDPFRYCKFCGADCETTEANHAAGCPCVTNVWPVTEQELGMRGPNDPYAHGMRCMDCGAEFQLGDSYTHRTVEEGEPILPGVEGAAIVEVICLGCAALESAQS